MDEDTTEGKDDETDEEDENVDQGGSQYFTQDGCSCSGGTGSGFKVNIDIRRINQLDDIVDIFLRELKSILKVLTTMFCG